MSKAHIMTGVIALAAVALVTIVQSKVMNVPVVGPYLPGYTAR